MGRRRSDHPPPTTSTTPVKFMGTSRSMCSYTISGSNEVIKRGDSVFIRSSDPSLPYVAQIEAIQVNRAGKVTVNILWYYRPEDAEGGRKPFHGSKELFLSDHVQIQPVDTIEGRCHVHDLESYMKLNTIDDCDYFTRFQYSSATGLFSPPYVDRYCSCNMPYNPDLPMIECEGCKDWFHYLCLNIGVEKETHFKCTECTRNEKVPDDSVTKDSLADTDPNSCGGKVLDDSFTKDSSADNDPNASGGKVLDDSVTMDSAADKDTNPSGGKIAPQLKVNGKHSDAGIRESDPVCHIKKPDAVELKRNLRDKRAERRHAPTYTVATDNRVALVYHDGMLGHTPPHKSFDEKPERLVAIMKKLGNEGLTKRCHLFKSVLASEESLVAVHHEDHVKKVQSLSDEDFASETEDIYYSQGSSTAALLAAGGALLASDLVVCGEFRSAFALVRPPGHHVSRDGPPAGFCLLNNIAAGAAHLMNNHKKERILILDWTFTTVTAQRTSFMMKREYCFFRCIGLVRTFIQGQDPLI